MMSPGTRTGGPSISSDAEAVDGGTSVMVMAGVSANNKINS